MREFASQMLVQNGLDGIHFEEKQNLSVDIKIHKSFVTLFSYSPAMAANAAQLTFRVPLTPSGSRCRTYESVSI